MVKRRANSNQRGSRRALVPRPVISMTQTEAFEAGLSRSNDVTTLRGKLVLGLSLTSTPASVLNIWPSSSGSFGVRAAAFAGVFSRYRFKYVKVRFLESSANAAAISLGVQDDISISAINPTTLNGVSELRCSGTSLAQQTMPTIFEWRPADSRLWLYTTSDGTDPRLSQSGVMWGASTVTSAITIEVDYCVVFKGAIDTGAL